MFLAIFREARECYALRDHHLNCCIGLSIGDKQLIVHCLSVCIRVLLIFVRATLNAEISAIKNTKWGTMMVKLCSDVCFTSVEHGSSSYEFWGERSKGNMPPKWW